MTDIIKEIDYNYWEHFYQKGMKRCILCGRLISLKDKRKLSTVRIRELFWDDNVNCTSWEDYDALCHKQCKEKHAKPSYSAGSSGAGKR